LVALPTMSEEAESKEERRERKKAKKEKKEKKEKDAKEGKAPKTPNTAKDKGKKSSGPTPVRGTSLDDETVLSSSKAGSKSSIKSSGKAAKSGAQSGRGGDGGGGLTAPDATDMAQMAGMGGLMSRLSVEDATKEDQKKPVSATAGGAVQASPRGYIFPGSSGCCALLPVVAVVVLWCWCVY